MTAPGDVTAIPALERTVASMMFALGTVPGYRVINSVVMPVTPPAIIIGPPRLSVRGYVAAGAGVTTAQFNVYLVVAANQYAIENLRTVAQQVMFALERWTEGVVMSSVPGVYPSPVGSLPTFIVTYQSEFH